MSAARTAASLRSGPGTSICSVPSPDSLADQRLLPKLVRVGKSPPAGALQHPQRLHVGFQDGFLLGALVFVLLAQANDGTQRLDVEAVALGFRIDVADIVGDRLFFFFQPLDA